MDVVDLETGEIVLEALFQQIPLLTPDEAKQAVTYFGRDGKSLVYASIRDLERDLLTCPVATNKLANFVKSNAFRNLKTHQELTNIRISLRRAIETSKEASARLGHFCWDQSDSQIDTAIIIMQRRLDGLDAEDL